MSGLHFQMVFLKLHAHNMEFGELLSQKKHTVNSKIMVCINHCKFVNSVLMKSMLSEIVLECNLYNERILQKT